MTRLPDALALAGELVDGHSMALPLLKITLLLIVAWILHGLLRARNPRWRILLWRGVAIGTLAVLFLAFADPLISLKLLATSSQAKIARSHPSQMFEIPPATPAGTLTEPRFHTTPAAMPPDRATKITSTAHQATRVARAADPWPIGTWLITIWAFGILVLGSRTLLGVLRLRGIRRGANPIPAWLQADANALLAGTRGIPIRHASQIPAPCSLGIFWPLILLPSPLCAEKHREELRAAIAHEAAHFQGHDLGWNLLLHLISLVGWFHPLLWRVRLAHADACDERCDAEAAQQLGNAHDYTRALARIALNLHPTPTPMVMTMARQSTIRRRLDMLATALGQRKLPVTGVGSVVLLATLVTLTVGTLGITRSTAKEERKASQTEPPANASEENKPEPTVENAATRSEEPFFTRVRVVDPDGNPVVGAEVEPWGLWLQEGGHGAWMNPDRSHGEPPVVHTDARGEAGIPLPQSLPPLTELDCFVTHPNFAEATHRIPVTREEPEHTSIIVIEPGAVVEIVAKHHGISLPAAHIWALTHSPSRDIARKALLDADGNIVLPLLPEGKDLLRIVYAPPDQPMLFSEPTEITLKNGDRRRLEIELRTSVTVTGRLDEGVPRPVKNGRVVANVFDKRKAIGTITNSRYHLHTVWSASSTIDDNGTFTLADVPAGPLQVTAICDGFVAANGAPPSFAKDEKQITFFSYPQVFSISTEQSEIEIGMRATGAAKIHVRDPQGKPIADVRVAITPNVKWWDYGSTIHSEVWINSREFLRTPGKPPAPVIFPFSAITDNTGLALITNLPPGDPPISVGHENWKLPLNNASGLGEQSVTIVAGETTDINFTQEPKTPDSIPALNSQSEVDVDPEEATPEPVKSNPQPTDSDR